MTTAIRKKATLEKEFQRRFVCRLKDELGGIAMKNDATYRQGFPDITFFSNRGEALIFEFKRSAGASRRPNQEHYIARLNDMGFRAFIVSPENEEEVLEDVRHPRARA